MKNTIKNFLLISFLLSICSFAFSQESDLESELQKFKIELNYTRLSASSYYNLNDSNIYTYSVYDAVNDTTRIYTFDYYHSIVGLKILYDLNTKLELSLYAPISFYSLDEKFMTDEYGNREKKASYSMNRVDYIGLNTLYRLVDKPIYTNLMGEVRIPTGFHNGLYNDSNRNFLSDGAFEFLLGAQIGVKYRTVAWENTLIYNYRAEDFKDQTIINTAIILSTVANTEIRVFGNFTLSTSKFDNARPMEITETISQENNYAVGAAFYMMFSDNFDLGVNYQVTLGGKNTWKSSFFNIRAGIRL